MKTLGLLLLGVALLPQIRIQLPGDPSSSLTALIEGTVVDAQNESPLADVRVRLLQNTPGLNAAVPGYESTADGNGRFVFEVPGGRYTLNAELLGWEQLEVHVITSNTTIPLGPRTQGRVRVSDLGSFDIVGGERYQVMIEMFDSIAGRPFGR
jgi:hypothetical protein